MALRGSCRVTATKYDDLIFEWVAQQSVPNNTSTIGWQLVLEAGAYGKIIATPGSAWEVTLGGSTFSGTTDIAIGNNSRKILASGTWVLAHNAQGEAAFDFAFRQDFHITFGDTYVGQVTGSGEAVLDPICRGVEIDCPEEMVLGKAVTLWLSGPGEYVCDLYCDFQGVTDIISQNVTANGIRWTPKRALAQRIPNAEFATAVIRCVSQGAVSRKEVLLRLPEDMVPTVEVSWQDSSGAMERVERLVQNVSALEVFTECAGVYGSTVASCAVLLEGKPYHGSPITDSGELTLAVEVTDSRGRKGTAAYPLTVSPYVQPQLLLEASRCDADGTHNDTGEFAAVTLTGYTDPLEGNNQAVLHLAAGETNLEVTPDLGSFQVKQVIPADSNATLLIRAVLTDALLSAGREMVLSTGYATLDLLAGGKGIAFGTTATREGFECAMPAFFTGGVEGVAPGGFGLGSDGTGDITLVSNLNEAVKTGFYACGESDVRFLPGVELEGGCLAVEAANGWVFQQLRKDGLCAQRFYHPDSLWQSWEWVNPPMTPGLEYRTTRRWLGKPVYVRLVDFGALPNAGTRAVDGGTMGFVCCIRGVVYGNGSYDPVGSGPEAQFYASGNQVCCRTTADLTACWAYVVLEYTD